MVLSCRYVDVHTLSRETLARVVASFPASFVRVRRATVLLTLRRHLIQAAKDERMRREAALIGGGDFIDKVHSAASDQSRQAQLKSINMAVELQKLKKSGAALPAGGATRGAGAGDDADEQPAAIAELQTEVKGMREDMQTLHEGIESILEGLREAIAMGGVGRAGAGDGPRAPAKPLASLPRHAPLITAVDRAATTFARRRADHAAREGAHEGSEA